MTSGQWDLNALEALEREAADIFDTLEAPEHVLRSTSNLQSQHHQHSHSHQHNHHSHHHGEIMGAIEDMTDIELEDHIKHCSCTCNHMGYGNFMDYQVSCKNEMNVFFFLVHFPL